MRLLSPKGTEIVRTLEILRGSGGIDPETLKRNADGTFEFDYDGDGTDVDWDSIEQATRKVQGKPQRVFFDENWEEFTEDELKLVEDEEEDEEAED